MRFRMRPPSNNEYRIYCTEQGCGKVATREIEDGRGYRAIFCRSHARDHHAQNVKDYREASARELVDSATEGDTAARSSDSEVSDG